MIEQMNEVKRMQDVQVKVTQTSFSRLDGAKISSNVVELRPGLNPQVRPPPQAQQQPTSEERQEAPDAQYAEFFRKIQSLRK